jgi:hypothetical protein
VADLSEAYGRYQAHVTGANDCNLNRFAHGFPAEVSLTDDTWSLEQNRSFRDVGESLQGGFSSTPTSRLARGPGWGKPLDCMGSTLHQLRFCLADFRVMGNST